MSNIMGKKALFYTTCIPFFIFFILFDLWIFPNAQWLQPSIETLQAILPGSSSSDGRGGASTLLLQILTHWTSSLFYIVSEIYSSVSVGLLFWQFANDVVPVHQAKRFYPLFAQMSGIAPILAGQYMVRYTSQASNFGTSLHRLTALVTISGIMICFFYTVSTSLIERMEAKEQEEAAAAAAVETGEKSVPELNQSQQPQTPQDNNNKTKKKQKPKLTMMESAKFLASSQYLRLIATLVVGYGLSISFTEITWKSLVKKQYPNALEYQRYMGNFSSIVGLSTCIVIFFGVHIIRILGWKIGALATPTCMFCLGIPFFVCIMMGNFDENPFRLSLAVTLGMLQSLFSKTSKYALFDPTTQMAYIPLDEESKVKGKAAIDVLGSRIGKSGGSFLQQGLVLVFGNLLNAAPIVAIIYYTVLLGWMNAANRLSGLFTAQTEMDKANKKEQAESRKDQ